MHNIATLPPRNLLRVHYNRYCTTVRKANESRVAPRGMLVENDVSVIHLDYSRL